MKKVLKVKDDKPLSDLEEYGFEEWNDAKEYRYYGNRSVNIRIKNKDRVVRLTAGTTRESVILFKMFKDGILEETYIEDKKYDNKAKLEQENESLKKVILDTEVAIAELMSNCFFKENFELSKTRLEDLLEILGRLKKVK